MARHQSPRRSPRLAHIEMPSFNLFSSPLPPTPPSVPPLPPPPPTHTHFYPRLVNIPPSSPGPSVRHAANTQPSRRFSPRLNNAPVVHSVSPTIVDVIDCDIKIFKKREGNPSFLYRSPFINRHVNVLRDLTQKERCMADWVFADLEKSEKLFKDKYMFITREDLNTLSSEDGISEKVVDLWAHLLNVGEKKRGSSSISRYFVPMPHMMLLYLSLNSYGEFCKLLEQDLPSANIDITKVQLTCFTIQDPRCPYMFYFNFKRQTIDIITVTSLNPETFSEAKTLAKALSKHFKGKKNNKASKVTSFKVQEFVLEWEKPKEWCDVGLYLMRYMETYKGDMKAWDPQLKLQTDAFLKKLRVKYCHSILTSEVNSLKETIEKKWREFQKLKI
ncbi:uncharacterized protein [Spinacia oleracea]|uniref:Uncharacterized protein isoform X2 n=1 Tax=Spinacia oleracea TaxID=3562 RepID=A0ABM3QIP2_SPIOL|nr:uncharacterized protein LOC110778961 isoform X2 [Spinacia oleracea]